MWNNSSLWSRYNITGIEIPVSAYVRIATSSQWAENRLQLCLFSTFDALLWTRCWTYKKKPTPLLSFSLEQQSTRNQKFLSSSMFSLFHPKLEIQYELPLQNVWKSSFSLLPSLSEEKNLQQLNEISLLQMQIQKNSHNCSTSSQNRFMSLKKKHTSCLIFHHLAMKLCNLWRRSATSFQGTRLGRIAKQRAKQFGSPWQPRVMA